MMIFLCVYLSPVLLYDIISHQISVYEERLVVVFWRGYILAPIQISTDHVKQRPASLVFVSTSRRKGKRSGTTDRPWKFYWIAVFNVQHTMFASPAFRCRWKMIPNAKIFVSVCKPTVSPQARSEQHLSGYVQSGIGAHNRKCEIKCSNSESTTGNVYMLCSYNHSPSSASCPFSS